ncbi:MAG: lysine--tRNA ligase, partial [Thermodesulfobacteriota bacterium]
MEQKESEYQQRIAKLEGLKKRGVNPYPNDFTVKDSCSTIKERFGSVGSEELEAANEVVTIAGRIMA